MPGKIIILEDHPDRHAAMRHCLADHFSQFEAFFFDNAPAMNRFLDLHLTDARLLSLDHDLEPQPDSAGQIVDPGTGRDVAEYLARKAPVCPLIIHTSNSTAAVGMELVLAEGGWKTYRVVPCGDMEWIPTDWARALRRAVTPRSAPKTPRRG
jgi:hypothetical protein